MPIPTDGHQEHIFWTSYAFYRVRMQDYVQKMLKSPKF